MYSNFKVQAIEYVKEAVQEDNAGNYAKAFSLYMNALEYFKTHLKYEKNPKIREAISKKFTEYLRRAEEIRAVLDEGLAEKITPPPITPTDFDNGLARQSPTVSKSDLEVHERFTQEFGEEGDHVKGSCFYMCITRK